jgi:hypothetical protein
VFAKILMGEMAQAARVSARRPRSDEERVPRSSRPSFRTLAKSEASGARRRASGREEARFCFRRMDAERSWSCSSGWAASSARCSCGSFESSSGQTCRRVSIANLARLGSSSERVRRAEMRRAVVSCWMERERDCPVKNERMACRLASGVMKARRAMRSGCEVT